jgi:hypothetical protein
MSHRCVSEYLIETRQQRNDVVLIGFREPCAHQLWTNVPDLSTKSAENRDKMTIFIQKTSKFCERRYIIQSSGCNSCTRHRSLGLLSDFRTLTYLSDNRQLLEHSTRHSTSDWSKNQSEEEPTMKNKVKAAVVLGAVVLFSVTAQAGVIVTPDVTFKTATCSTTLK